MTDENTSYDEELEDDSEEMTEAEMRLADLKNRADTLGIKFHPSIKEEKLLAKIKEAMEDNAVAPVETEGAMRTNKPDLVALKNEALKLVHVRITCMDPMKKEFQGDYFTTGNSLIGTIRRFVPFGVEWHVPQIMLNLIQEKEYQMHTTKKSTNGMETNDSRMVKTYAVEILKPMTKEELSELAQRQAMAKGAAA